MHNFVSGELLLPELMNKLLQKEQLTRKAGETDLAAKIYSAAKADELFINKNSITDTKGNSNLKVISQKGIEDNYFSKDALTSAMNVTNYTDGIKKLTSSMIKASSLTTDTSGYVLFENGILINYGYVKDVASKGTTNQTFPSYGQKSIQYSTTAYFAVCTCISHDDFSAPYVYDRYETSIKLKNNDGRSKRWLFYMAMGPAKI